MTILIFTIFTLLNLNASTLIIDNFEDNKLIEKGRPVAPKNWSEGNKKAERIDYYIIQKNKNKFLRGEYLLGTKGEIIYFEKKIDIKKTPFLSWKWKANKLPSIKIRKDNEEADNVATVYVLFKKGWVRFLIKYSWSQVNCKKNKEKESGYFRSKSSRRGLWEIYIKPIRCTNHKLKCCSDPTGVWLSEKVNLIDDFKLIFKKDWIPGHIEGIGILVDGDQTKIDGVSADFDDFVLSSK